MIRPTKNCEVFLYQNFIDMRRQIDGLALIVEQALELNPLSGSLFVFCNKKRDKLKILLWERSGFILWYKRLEKDRFKWPRRLEEDCISLTGEELNWIIDGFDIFNNKPHQRLYFTGVS